MSNRASHWLDICLDFGRRLGSQPCLLCGAASTRGLLCSGCLGDLPILPEARCPRCALPTPNGELCGACLRHPPGFEHAEAVFRYAHPAASLIQALKYRGELSVARFLGERLAQRLDGQPRPDLIIPMPLHPNRLRERGFNQAAEIAKHLASLLAIPLLPGAVKRTRDSAPQASLPLRARIKNMRGTFACEHDLSRMRIALVDDVMTSGASLDELARAVGRAGAVEVSAWVAARTLPR